MSESTMRGRVIKVLKVLHAIPVENPVQPGTPDVNYIDGWIELKWLRSWPARKDTPVKIEHFTRRQRRWLLKRERRGGNSWLLLQVGREWLLFKGGVAAKWVGLVPRENLVALCHQYWPNGLNEKELIECLKNANSET